MPSPGASGASLLPDEALATALCSTDGTAVDAPTLVRVRQPSNAPDGVRAEDLPELGLVVSAADEPEPVRCRLRMRLTHQ